MDDVGVMTRDYNEGAYGFEECANFAGLVSNDAIDSADIYKFS